MTMMTSRNGTHTEQRSATPILVSTSSSHSDALVDPLPNSEDKGESEEMNRGRDPKLAEMEKRIVRSGWADVRTSRLALIASRQWLVLTDVALFIYKEKEEMTPPRSWPLYAISGPDVASVSACSAPFARHSLELGTRRAGPTPARKFVMSFKAASERDNWIRALAIVRESVVVLDVSSSEGGVRSAPSVVVDAAEPEPQVDGERIPFVAEPLPVSGADIAAPSRPLSTLSTRPHRRSFLASKTTLETEATASSRRTSYSSWRASGSAFGSRHNTKRLSSEAQVPPRRHSAVSSFISFANTSLTSLVTLASERSGKSAGIREEEEEGDASGSGSRSVGLGQRHGNNSDFSLFSLTLEPALRSCSSLDIVRPRAHGEGEGEQEDDFPLDTTQAEEPADLTGAVTKAGAWPVGGGGYADVWEGKWTVNGKSRAVAIKVIRTFSLTSPSHPPLPSAQPNAAASIEAHTAKIARRLQRELVIWHQLRGHPHVVPLWGTVQGFGPFVSFVAPWMRNGNAWEWLKRLDGGGEGGESEGEGGASMEGGNGAGEGEGEREREGRERRVERTRGRRLKLLLEVAEALEFIHTRDPPIVHGDLKPCNVLINDREEACLADFGLSSVLHEAAGLSPASLSAHVGSTRYLAFELVVPPRRPGSPTVQSSARSYSSRASSVSTKRLAKPNGVKLGLIDATSPAPSERGCTTPDSVDWNETPHCTTASDVWAFGSTAYEILSGRVPYYHRANDLQVLYEIMLLRRPQHQGTAIPMHVWTWLEQACWAADPRERPAMEVVVRTVRMFVEAHRLGGRATSVTRSAPSSPVSPMTPGVHAKRALPPLPTLSRTLSRQSSTLSSPAMSVIEKGKQVVIR